MRVFWITASKGGSGKTLLSMITHRALFEHHLSRFDRTLLLDLNYQNRDLFNIVKKSIDSDLQSVYISDGFERRRIALTTIDNGPTIGVVEGFIPIKSYVSLPILLGYETNAESVIVDTNLNLSSLSTLTNADTSKARRLILDHGNDIDPIVLFIWTSGSIMRYGIHDGQLSFEVEATMNGLTKLAGVFGLS